MRTSFKHMTQSKSRFSNRKILYLQDIAGIITNEIETFHMSHIKIKKIKKHLVNMRYTSLI